MLPDVKGNILENLDASKGEPDIIGGQSDGFICAWVVQKACSWLQGTEKVEQDD
jgi:hypothetical protein